MKNKYFKQSIRKIFNNSHLLATQRQVSAVAFIFFIAVILPSCEKKSTAVIREQDNLNIIQDLQVINTSFFGHTQTAEKVFIVSGDAKIISHNVNTSNWQSLPTPAITGKFVGIASDKTGARLLAYGEQGLLVYSSNAGKTWNQRNSGISKTFTSAIFDEQNQRWLIVGHDGAALWANTDATDWMPLNLQVTQTLVKILHTEKFMLIIGDKGLIAVSQLPVKDWQIVKINLDESLTDITAIDTENFVAGSSSGKFILINTERSTANIINSGYSSYISKILYDHANKTLIATSANGEILLSDDGGHLWAPVVTGKPYLNSIIQSDDKKNLWAAGDNGCILSSQNGGRTWDNLAFPSTANIEGLITLSGPQLIAYGEGGALFQSQDHGIHWETINYPVNEFTHQIIQSKSGVWYGAGIKGQLIASTNNGQQWQMVTAPTQKNDYFLSIIEDEESGNLIAVGPPGSILLKEKGSHDWRVRLALNDASQGYFHRVLTDNHGNLVTVAGPGSIYYSHDAGKNWNKADDSNTEPQLFTGIYDKKRKQFFAAGQSGVIKVSTNGERWKTLQAPVNNTLQALYANDKVIVAVGDKGIILRSEEGETWHSVQTPTQTMLIALFESKHGSLIATGNEGVILLSEDQGKFWKVINSPTTSGLRTPVQDLETGIIYIASRSGEIIYSKDNGLTWSQFSVIANGSIKSLFIDYENKMLIGAGDKLMRIPLLQ